jgi:hypothetical protein
MTLIDRYWPVVEDLLRSRGGFAVGRGKVPIVALIGTTTFFCAVYGAAMGSFSLRPAQMAVSAIKVPSLLFVTTLVALPSFFVLNAVLGLADDFAAALRGIFVSQATLAVCLAAFFPVTLLAYLSSDDYRFALNFNGLPFFIASLTAHRTLARHYAPLIAKNRLHRVVHALWLFLYIFIAIQLAWTLRPFVGDPSMPSELFRKNAWSNAYVEVLKDLVKLSRRDR